MSFKAGFGKEIITPARGIPLAGYFNPRPNKGFLDDLCVKALLFSDGEKISGIVSYDLCFLSDGMVDGLIAALKKAGFDFADRLSFCATHTHTGPYTMPLFSCGEDPGYIAAVEKKTVLAVSAAKANLYESELYFGSVNSNPLAFNRRFYMKNGKVVTNPGKLNADIVRPEGTVDTEIGVAEIKQDDRTYAVIANIVNHTDTIGGDMVSADWPGRMEREVQKRAGFEVPVITLIGCSGNINHFDVSNSDPQTSYSEAERIGSGYAKIVADTLPSLKKLERPELSFELKTLEIKRVLISPERIAEAEKTVGELSFGSGGVNLTSEDLAKGADAVRWFFADQLLSFVKESNGKKLNIRLSALKFGRELAIVFLPGEPFTEIGLEIKRDSGFKRTFVASLAFGECGYIPLKDCYGRGGYETLPVTIGGVSPETAAELAGAAGRLLK